MPNRSLTIQGTEVGLDINKVSIYKDSISSSNLVGTVDKSIFMSGYSFIDDDQQEDYVCQGDDPCRTVLNLSIRAANQPPTVTITGATSSLTNANVTLTANANDPEGFPLTYLWSTGETTQSITVNSSTAQTATYEVTVTDDIGDTGSDTHNIVWTVPTTTTTTSAPGPTTTTTAAPCTDCAGDINSISDFSAAVGGSSGTISLSGTNVTSFSVYTWDPSLVNVSVSGSSLSWSTNSSNTCGTAHVRVFANNTAGGNCCTEAEDFYITVTGCTGPTTTTTTTQAPATTTTTTTQAPATTTTTTTAPPVNCYIYDVGADGGDSVTFTYTRCTGGTATINVPNGDAAQTLCAVEGSVTMSPNTGTITVSSSC